jgi:hypothetical protein
MEAQEHQQPQHQQCQIQDWQLQQQLLLGVHHQILKEKEM